MVAALRFASLAFLGLFLTAAHADIVHGTKRADVIAELGTPTSTARRGAREILQYPKGMRLELEGGVVVDIRGYTSDGRTTVAPVVPPADQPAANAAPPPAADTAKTPPPASAPPATMIREDYSSAAAANALGDEVEKMGTAWGGGVTAPLPDPIKRTNWAEFSLRLVFRFLLTVGLLRAAFKYWEMDAFWSGTLAIAGIDAAIHGILEALVPLTEGFSTLGQVDVAVAWTTMIFTIRHFCFSKRLQTAVWTAMLVKGLVMAFDILVFIALVDAILG